MGLFTITPQGRRNFRVLKWWGIGVLALVAVLGLASLTPAGERLLATASGGQDDGPRAFPSIQASELALRDIPLAYLAYYHDAAEDACPELRWQLLAGIGKVETNHGQSDAPGVKTGLNRAGCCAGPMQFNLVNGPPSTWNGVGGDYNRDGRTDVYDPADAIPAAAAKLCANGLEPSPENRKWKGALDADPCPEGTGTPAEHRALRRYNNACWYVHEVLEFTDRYTSGSPANPPPDQDPFLVALTDHPNITTTSDRGCDPAADLTGGNLDIRVRSLLLLLAEDYQLRISCLISGHSKFVKGTSRVSNHFVGRAVDIDTVNGQPVSAHSPAARALVAHLDTLAGSLRPSEVGSPFGFGRRPFFTDPGHQGHVHVGYSRTYNP